MVRGRKGTEKPIEIFVALFVILAVALVMLKLFQNQITEKQLQLKNFEQERKQQDLKENALQYCTTKCTDASNDGCSLKGLATFCMAYGTNKIKSPNFLDLNLDNVNGYDTTFLAGIGVCEDAVPCHSFLSNCCGQQLNGASCKSILEQYWKSRGFNDSEIPCLIKNNVKRGTCTPTPGSSFWYDRDGYADLASQCTS